jgi:hypothetical protein
MNTSSTNTAIYLALRERFLVALSVCLTVFGSPLASVGKAAGFSVEVGDILAANYNGDSVLKISPQTGAQEILGTFTRPTDLVLAPNGDLYVSELGGSIKRLTLTNGAITRINPTSSLTAANGLVLGPSGDLFVTGSGNRVLRVNPITGDETLITQGDNLNTPVGIDFFDANTLAVASQLTSPIILVNLANGTQTAAPGAEGIDYPWGVAVRGGDIFFTRYDQKALQRLSGGTLSLFRVTQGFPYGLAIESDGNLLVGSHTPDMIERISPQGQLLRMYTGGAIRQVTGIDVATIRVGIPSTNDPPVLDPIENKTVDEGVRLSFQVTASDSNSPPQTLTFSLEPGAPVGANLSTNGLFEWTPNESQGGSTNVINVKVVDDGAPPLSDTNSFTVIVNKMAPAFVLQSSLQVEGPYQDESSAVVDLQQQTISISQPSGSYFYRIRGTQMVRIVGVRIQAGRLWFDYQLL